MIVSFLTSRYANSYLVVDKNNDAFLVDIGDRNEEIKTYLKQHNFHLKAILLTHGHFDHIENIGEFLDEDPSIAVYLHRLEKDFLLNSHLNLSMFGFKGENFHFSYQVKNLHLVEDQEIIKIGEEEIKVIFTPFHTQGSVCYYLKSEEVLFSGDTLFYSTIGRSDLPTSNPVLINNSLRKLLLLDDQVIIYPGHGIKTTILREKKHNPNLIKLFQGGKLE